MATILKPNDLPTIRPAEFRGVAGFNLDDFAAAGVRHLKQVEAEAAKTVAAAKREAEEIRRVAAEEGRARGVKQAEDDVRKKIKAGVAAEIAARMPLLESAVRQIGEAEEVYLSEFRSTLITTIVAATERVVLARLEHEPAVLERWAASAVESCKSARRLVLAVHPETLVVHGEVLERLVSAPGLPEDARIEADESVEPAGIVVRVDGGEVDRTLHVALDRLDEMLRGA